MALAKQKQLLLAYYGTHQLASRTIATPELDEAKSRSPEFLKHVYNVFASCELKLKAMQQLNRLTAT